MPACTATRQARRGAIPSPLLPPNRLRTRHHRRVLSGIGAPAHAGADFRRPGRPATRCTGGCLGPGRFTIAGIVGLRNRVMGWFGLNYDERLQGHARVEEQPPTYEAYLAFSEGMASYIGTMIPRRCHSFSAHISSISSFTLALLYASLALTNTGDVAQADSVLQRITPSRARLSATPSGLARVPARLCRRENEANLSAIRRAAGLAPGSKAVYNQAVAAFQTGHLAEALEALQRLSPDRGPMHGFVAYWDLLGAVRHARGEYEQELELGKEATRRFLPGWRECFQPSAPLLEGALRRFEYRLGRRQDGAARSGVGRLRCAAFRGRPTLLAMATLLRRLQPFKRPAIGTAVSRPQSPGRWPNWRTGWGCGTQRERSSLPPADQCRVPGVLRPGRPHRGTVWPS